MANQENNKYDSLNQPAENKQQLAYQQIKEDILNNTYPEGTVMVERKLCDIYHVSRSPIRNALQQLTHEGLLSFVPGKGTVVASFTTEDILEVYDLIELLQTYAVSACINKSNALAVNALEVALENMKKSLDNGDIYHCTRWDQKFHELLVSYSGNKRLETIYEQLDCQQMLFISTILDDMDRAQNSYKEHTAILDAIKAKDSEAAHDCICRHYYHIKQYYINKLLSRIHI